MDIQYGLKMLDMCKRTNSHEKIVGWFSTGAEITNHSLLIHDYYRRETPQPVHLLVDTSLREGCRLRVAAYTSTPIGVPKKTTGVMFTPVQHVDVASTSSRPERVTLDTFIQHARDSLLRPAAPSSSTTPQSGKFTFFLAFSPLYYSFIWRTCCFSVSINFQYSRSEKTSPGV